jgi:cytochrome c-type biogenesis protein CcmH/NrfF
VKAALAAVVLVALAAAPALAAPEDVANEISTQIMSPYCPGVTLHDCPSDAAVALRAKIVEWVEDGFSRAQIMSALEAEFDRTIRARPPFGGSGLLAWLLPGIAALGGAALGWWFLRKWVQVPARPEGYDPDVHITEQDRKRLDVELNKLRGET